MSVFQVAIFVTGTLLNVLLVGALFWRGHHRREPFFVAYALAILITHVALVVWYSWDMWLLHQTVTAAFRFGVALSLAYSVFRNFPGAAVTARRVTFLVLGATLVGVLALTDWGASYTDISAALIPSIANGTVWLFTALAALVLWYRLPLTSLQKAILLAFAPYLLVFTVTMNLLASLGYRVRNEVGYADTISFLLVLGYWCREAWRSEAGEHTPAPPGAAFVMGAGPPVVRPS